MSGNSSIHGFEQAHTSDLNCVMCHRSINYVADMLETKYGVPWIKVNFIGTEASAKSLRKMAQYFESDKLTQQVEKVITEEMAKVESVRKRVTANCTGKTAMLFVGGSRAHHYQELFGEVGVECVAAGYEFAHRDDYEGRKVLPTVKLDADSRNIEELEVLPDKKLFNPRKSPERLKEMAAEGLPLKEYEGMMPTMKDGRLIIDDISHIETERLIEILKPDIFCAGIKEKYIIQKMGLPCKQLHSYDYGGPYAGFAGAVNFWNDIDRMMNTCVWTFTTPPWAPKDVSPTIEAEFVAP
jgi:nitrogenase molybdenum-iron protein alpha chain